VANFTFSPIILTISIIFFFVLFIFVYLRVTSEYFTSSRFKRFTIFLILAYLLAISAAFIINNYSDSPKRLAVFPPANLQIPASEIESWAMADLLNDQLIKKLPSTFLIYPTHWLMQAINLDSLTNREYIEKFARRINLDYLIFPSSNFFDKDQIKNVNSQTSFEIKNTRKTDSKKKSAESIQTRLSQILEQISFSEQEAEFSQVSVQSFLLIKEGKFEKAVETLESFYKTDTSFVKSRNLLAHCFLESAVRFDYLGKPSGLYKFAALRLCEGTVSRHDSLNAKAFQLLGQYYLLEKMWAKAEENYLKAFKLNDRIPELYFGFSHLHDSRSKKIGRKNKEALLRKTIEINPCYEIARINLADYLYFKKWPNRARKEINKLLKINPTSIEGLFYLGKLAVAENNIDEIVAIYNKILDIEPRNVDAFYNLGVYYYNLGNIGTATQFFERAVLYGNHLNSHLYLGHIYQSRGEIDKAIAEYRYRIKYKRGMDDTYADEARKRLYNLTDADSALDAFYGRNK
jgi:tetratricopeptide (TPR) repeat protein